MLDWVQGLLGLKGFAERQKPGWAGRPTRQRLHAGRVKAHHPLQMNREMFDTHAACLERFRELRQKKTPDLCRGTLGEKFYVAYR